MRLSLSNIQMVSPAPFCRFAWAGRKHPHSPSCPVMILLQRSKAKPPCSPTRGTARPAHSQVLVGNLLYPRERTRTSTPPGGGSMWLPGKKQEADMPAQQDGAVHYSFTLPGWQATRTTVKTTIQRKGKTGAPSCKCILGLSAALAGCMECLRGQVVRVAGPRGWS